MTNSSCSRLISISKELFSIAAVAFSLAGCSNDPNASDPLAQVRQAIAKLGPEAPRPTAAQIRANLTPEVQAQFGDAPLMVATLEELSLASVLIGLEENRGVFTFSTPDGVSFAFNKGLLVASRGLGFDLMDADVADIQKAVRAKGGTEAVRIHRYLDGENQTKIHSFICDVAIENPRQLRENCYGDDLQFQNTYQLGQNGNILGSRQWIGPKRGYLVVETVR